MKDPHFIPPNVYLDRSFAQLRGWIEDKRPTSVVVIMDRMTERHCLPLLSPHLPPGTQFLGLSQIGEPNKTLEHAHAIWDSLDGIGMDRHGLVISLGGGTITDLGAFVASTYLRGVNSWLIPTTLLGMVDASVGGKTGVNFNGLKNRIGTFQTAQGISINPGFLGTLPPREIANGWAEHVKHRLIHSVQGVEDLLRIQPAHAEAASLESAILDSVRIKQHIVEEDPLEQNGNRKVLNFGHTIGHAFESWAMDNETDLKHGEAIAWGMRVALKMSELRPDCPGAPAGHFEEVSHYIASAVPISCPVPDAAALWALMQSDKKNVGGRVQVVLLNGFGCPVPHAEVDFEHLNAAINALTPA